MNVYPTICESYYAILEKIDTMSFEEKIDRMTQALELKAQALELKTQALELKTQALELKTQALELKTQALELRTQALELKEEEEEEEEEEIWRTISVAPAYIISNKGRIMRKSDGFMPKIGTSEKTRYCRVRLGGTVYYLHRLLAQAFIPNPQNKPYVDHIDGNKLNNSLSNLRWATPVENQRNRGKQTNNTSGYKGVTFDKARGRWRAQINTGNNKVKNLGCYDTAEEAGAVYEEVAKELHGEFFCKR